MPCRDDYDSEPDYSAMMRAELLCEACRTLESFSIAPGARLAGFWDLHKKVDETREAEAEARKAWKAAEDTARANGFRLIEDHPLAKSLSQAMQAHYAAQEAERSYLRNLYHQTRR